MIIDNVLREWLAERSRQLGTVEDMEAFGRSLRATGPLAELQQELASCVAGQADAILAAARTFLDAGGHEPAIAALIRATRADPFFRPPLRRVVGPVHLGLLLMDNDILSILLAVTSPDSMAAKRRTRAGPASITFPGRRSMFRFVKSGGAILSFWAAPEIDDDFSAAASARCRQVGRRRIADGETIMIDGRRETFIVDHLVSDMVYVQAVTPAQSAPLAVEYDSDTLAFAGASSTDEIGSRAQMMVSLLRLLDRSDAVPLFGEGVNHRHFNVRWHVMREFLALDAEAALPHLRAMAANDPHPEVRSAAAQTLAAFFPDAPIKKEESLCPA